MATRTSSQSGNWSSTSTWGGAAVPANGDAVIISTGHDVVFDVDQSGFANGLLSLQIDGILRFKVDAVTYLKMNGNITGTGELYVGNSEADPIQRPDAGSESRCQLVFNSSGTINIPTIRMYGWYPESEFTQLDADAELGSNQIVLKEDLELQTGDKIEISIRSMYSRWGDLLSSGYECYTVQSYDSNTKTVTLTSPLTTKGRTTMDYVAIWNRPIKISRTSTTANIISITSTDNINSDINNIINIGVNWTVAILSGKYVAPTKPSLDGKYARPDNLIFKHCTITDAPSSIMNTIYTNCNFLDNRYGGAMASYSENIILNNCISIGQNYGIVEGVNQLIKDSVILNTMSPTLNSNVVFKNCVINCKTLNYGMIGSLINCEIDSYELDFKRAFSGLINIINCLIKDNILHKYMVSGGKIKLFNTLFEENIEIAIYENSPLNDIIESFNHNQIEGNYKSWCKGGRIETENNKLKFICESDDYPVFRDYPILAPANRTIKFLIGLTKDTSGIITKLQIIDPSNDPLIDSTATPLAESTAQDTTDNQQLGIAYKSTTPKQLILRILCQNSSGNVVIDTTRIDQSLAKRIS
jgi:hypothetical protein